MSEAGNQNHSDGPADPPPGNGAPQAGPQGYGRQAGTPAREDEVSLLDILLVLARHKTLIVRTVLVFTLLGVTHALMASEEYTSSAKVVRQRLQFVEQRFQESEKELEVAEDRLAQFLERSRSLTTRRSSFGANA